MIVHVPEDPIFQRHSGLMDTGASVHTEGEQEILTLNLDAKDREVGFGACRVSGWEGAEGDEPIHMTS